MILILGTPGAGKTTQTQRLAEYLKCRWFSMGQLIRDNVTGDERRDMLAGKIISDQTSLDMVDKVLSQFDTNKEECVFEGNPRSVAQAKWWVAQQQAGRFKIRAVIHLVVDFDVAEQRLDKRGRLDDHDDNVVETRFNEYKKSITPTLAYLKSNGLPVYDIDANVSIEEESALIQKALGV